MLPFNIFKAPDDQFACLFFVLVSPTNNRNDKHEREGDSGYESINPQYGGGNSQSVDKQHREQRGHAGTSDEDGERYSPIHDAQGWLILLSLLAHEHFNRDKSRHDGCADQRLLAKRGSRNTKTVVSKVRRGVGHDRRTAQGKSRYDYEMDEPPHLFTLCRRRARSRFDADWSMAAIRPVLCAALY